MSTMLRESIKEGLRIIVSSLVTISITSLAIIAMGINPEKGTLNINWTLVSLSALLQMVNGLGTAITKAWDKYTHLENKELNVYPNGRTPSMGIIPF